MGQLRNIYTPSVLSVNFHFTKMYSVSYTTPSCWIWNQIYSRQMELVPRSIARDKYWAPKTKKMGTPSLTNIHLNTFLSLVASQNWRILSWAPKLAQKWKTVGVMSKMKMQRPGLRWACFLCKSGYQLLICSNLFQSNHNLFLSRFTGRCI